MDGLRELGDEVWFSLGDRDLAIALTRRRALEAGTRPTDVHATLLRALGVTAKVLPMSDQPVRTKVLSGGRWLSIQEYLIGARRDEDWEPVQDVAFRGAEVARATSEVLGAVADADVIVIGPSNPIISIGPILALEDLRAAIAASSATVIAVSPIVSGAVLKGPTAEFMRWRALELKADSIVRLYEGLLDGLVSDEPADSSPTLVTDVRMEGAQERRRLAERVLQFAAALRDAGADTK
jgi:LPPG:FO 2-phospho-L-lactate transferase